MLRPKEGVPFVVVFRCFLMSESLKNAFHSKAFSLNGGPYFIFSIANRAIF